MKKILILVLTLVCFQVANAQSDLKPYFNTDKHGLWVDGYDPVGYFTDKKALEGKKEFSTVYKGATFRFVSKAHQDLFKANPEKYLPQYGGYCAYALGSYGEKVEVDPETFQMKDGKLYLFYNKLFTNTYTSWKKDEASLNKKADATWATFKHTK
jgi:YHS domain-containing protein